MDSKQQHSGGRESYDTFTVGKEGLKKIGKDKKTKPKKNHVGKEQQKY